MALARTGAGCLSRCDEFYLELRKQVSAGALRPGQRLPSERELEKQYGISRATVSKALVQLKAEGVVCRIPGRKGTFVAESNGRIGPQIVGKVAKFVVPGRKHSKTVSHGVLEGIHDVVSQSGVDVAVSFMGDGEQGWYERLLSSVKGNNCLGLIFWYDPRVCRGPFLRSIEAEGVPAVFVDAYPPDAQVDFVVTDNVAGAHQLVDHLVKLGHRRICYVSSALDRTSTRDRRTGFLRGVVDNRLSLSSTEVIEVAQGDGDLPGAVDAVVEQLLQDGRRWTAVVASNDALAVELERSLIQRQVAIPEDISLAGYDDIDQAALLPVPLTTVKQDFYQMGKVAAEILMERLEGGVSQRVSQVFLPARLVVRESAGQRAGHGPR